MLFGRKSKSNHILLDRQLLKKLQSDKDGNVLVIGSSGSGKAHRPWDCLKLCICGERPLLMYKKDAPYYCGGQTKTMFAVCPKCGRATKKSDIVNVINNWNDDDVELP